MRSHNNIMLKIKTTMIAYLIHSNVFVRENERYPFIYISGSSFPVSCIEPTP